MNHGYTVVLIEQVTEPPEPERKVTNIFSPDFYQLLLTSEETSNLFPYILKVAKI